MKWLNILSECWSVVSSVDLSRSEDGQPIENNVKFEEEERNCKRKKFNICQIYK